MCQRTDMILCIYFQFLLLRNGTTFALGDTCYSRSEDVAVFNPDGKEIISRDNEVSLLRKSEPDKAYYNCHTDITIPYDEIGRISVVDYSGKKQA